MREETMRRRTMTLIPGRHLGWWAQGRHANGHLFMMTWWPTEGLARVAARLVGGGSPIRTRQRSRRR
jgi:hypothetical protein